ncbi:hypothetical protein JRC04_19030 [Mycolicibacterium sp. S2-37]|uniref:hypothetical protein n=1 Tax=Mycolicibacterium sp. S2-37 TaxID=2810297 RepID=UPI001A943949|nr:hypothetical protein [Mycolicibacterium sp. S2-37]MBO0679562.1 hypothetical protein [Mycolicibacterium sp. S2-37]
MTVYEALTIALIILLAAVTTVAIYLGMMNWIGAAYVVRCAGCHHLTVASANEPQPSCPHCRHPALMHPLYSAHHLRGQKVRVVGDRLRY